MGITSSLSTALSGLAANQQNLDVIGNNISNVNTVGFKASRMDFKSQFSQSFSFGSAPNGNLGGTNPLQIGMGTVAGGVSRDFADGSNQVTGVTSNLAIQGDGFFIVKDTSPFYTRDGSFKLNSSNELVNSDGLRVQGYGVDSRFNVATGTLQDISVPIGSLTVAEATKNVTVEGNLNTNGVLPTTVANTTLGQPLFTSNGAGGVTGTAPTGATLLTALSDAGGAAYFQNGDVISMTGKVGTRLVNSKTLTVGAGTSLADLESFVNGTLGINTTAGANGSIATVPGTSFAAGPAGAVVLNINGNPGLDNDLTLDSNSLQVTTGSSIASPFTWNKNATADGESIYTQSTVYDSLGTPVTLNMVASLISRDSNGSTWQVYGTSPDGAGTGAATQTAVGLGTLRFDTSGTLVNSTPTLMTIDRSNTGAVPNFTFDVLAGAVSGLSDKTSTFAVTLQDGSAKGTLQNYSIDQSGIVKGSFSNGLSRTLGQIALATFKNNQGLIDQGSNLWSDGPNSGIAVIGAPGDFGAGKVVSGALELSNVDLSSEFVQLISASTGFSASSRVITTSNQLLQELLSAAR